MNKLSGLIKGFLTRKNNKKLKDGMTKDLVKQLLDNFILSYLFLNKINLNLTYKKCRHENFPSHISENIVKFAFLKKFNIIPTWYCKPGDLELLGKKIEVKGFSSSGPSSFGPTENWDILCFVDCTKFLEKRFKIYIIKLSNKNIIWKNIKFTKNLTYEEIVNKNSRGQLRCCFSDIYSQIPKEYKYIIFDGHIDEL